MSKLGNYIGHRVCLFLTLVGLMSGAVLPDYLWPRRAFAQAPVPQVTTPGWSYAGNFNMARGDYTATLLANGKVLVAGGGSNSPYDWTSSAELYDPATGTWSYTGNLHTPRRGHTATLLANGKVLVAGGEWGTDQFLNSAELYDPATGTWHPTGSLNFRRFQHTATLLANGKVLLLGFYGSEIYDPATGMWNWVPNLSTIRAFHTVTLLTNGKVLVTGKSDVNGTSIAELYDPETGMSNATGSLNTIRDIYTTTLLTNGKVLVTGCGDVNCLRWYAEFYDPASGTWNRTGSPGDWGWPAILLANGKVLVASAGYSQLYDPATGRWSSTTNLGGGFSTATLLSNGQVLFTTGEIAALFDFGLAPSGTVSSVSAASYSLMGLTSEAIATAFGTGLAMASSAASTLPLPTELAGTTVKLKDSAGDERFAPLFYVSPQQVNYQIPPGTAAGAATVTITSGDGTISNGVAIIRAVAPGLFTANADGQGVAAAMALRVKADGSQSYELVAQFDAAQNKFISRPIDLGPEGERVYLLLFGTGIRHRRTLSSVIATIGSVYPYPEVSYAGAQGDFTGLDQINVLVPRSLVGRGEVNIVLLVDSQLSNLAQISIK